MALLNIHEPGKTTAHDLLRPGRRQQPLQGLPLLRLGFRPFYLVAALQAAIALPLWVAAFLGHAPFGLQPGLAWHVHEMVFGFAVAVIIGFLYTAVRNWTGRPTPRGTPLAALVLLWCAARVGLLVAPSLPSALLDIAFLPAAAWPLWRLLRKTDNRRNQFFPLLLLGMALLNAVHHAAVFGWIAIDPVRPLRGALLMVVLIATIMGGRVIPSFTANAVPGAQPKTRPREDRLSVVLLALACAGWIAGAPSPAMAGLFAAAGLSIAKRALGYQPQRTTGHPLLWILHAAHLWIAVGLLLLAAAELRLTGESAGWHALGVGAIAGLIIGMITRTALGHTGRMLRTGPAESLMFLLLQLGAVLRVLAALNWTAAYGQLLVAAAACWSVAFGLYVAIYAPRLLATRVDGKDG